MAKLKKYSKCTADRFAQLLFIAVAAVSAVVVIVKAVRLVRGLCIAIKLGRLAGAVVSLAGSKR